MAEVAGGGQMFRDILLLIARLRALPSPERTRHRVRCDSAEGRGAPCLRKRLRVPHFQAGDPMVWLQTGGFGANFIGPAPMMRNVALTGPGIRRKPACILSKPL